MAGVMLASAARASCVPLEELERLPCCCLRCSVGGAAAAAEHRVAEPVRAEAEACRIISLPRSFVCCSCYHCTLPPLLSAVFAVGCGWLDHAFFGMSVLRFRMAKQIRSRRHMGLNLRRREEEGGAGSSAAGSAPSQGPTLSNLGGLLPNRSSRHSRCG